MRKAGVGAAAVVLLAMLMFLAVSSWSRQPAVAKPSVQPIAFPHNVHVQTYKIDCQYCHADARRSSTPACRRWSAAWAATRSPAPTSPRSRSCAEYAAKREPIPWTRVYKLPEFTHFPHKPHIRAELRVPDLPRPGRDDDDRGRQHRPDRSTNDLLNLAGLRPGRRR
mgnify:CR=1 FL=1